MQGLIQGRAQGGICSSKNLSCPLKQFEIHQYQLFEREHNPITPTSFASLALYCPCMCTQSPLNFLEKFIMPPQGHTSRLSPGICRKATILSVQMLNAIVLTDAGGLPSRPWLQSSCSSEPQCLSELSQDSPSETLLWIECHLSGLAAFQDVSFSSMPSKQLRVKSRIHCKLT